MRLLLDTHAFLWACDNPDRLPAKARDAIESGLNDVFVSAASAWEISIKVASGKLDFRVDRWPEMLHNLGFDPLSITPAHGIAAGQLPRHHADPFDRVLISQAQLENLTLVTVDSKMLSYDVQVFGRSPIH